MRGLRPECLTFATDIRVQLTVDFLHLAIPQRERARGLEATLEQLRGEVSAQGLAMEGLAAERDAARSAAREASARANASVQAKISSVTGC